MERLLQQGIGPAQETVLKANQTEGRRRTVFVNHLQRVGLTFLVLEKMGHFVRVPGTLNTFFVCEVFAKSLVLTQFTHLLL